MKIDGKPMKINENVKKINEKPMKINGKPMEINENGKKINEKPMKINKKPMKTLAQRCRSRNQEIL